MYQATGRVGIARPLGQHWTFGHTVRVPVEASPAPILELGGLAITPCTALCVIITILAIISTIILALIPLYIKAPKVQPKCISDPFSTIFNINEGFLPSGPLSTDQQAVLQSGLNGYVSNQKGFSYCSVQMRNADVDICSIIKRFLQNRSGRRRRQSYSQNRVHQTNTNCLTQQLVTTSVLNCGCKCIGVCLNKKVQQLNSLLRSISISITLPGPTSVIVVITGADVPILEPITTMMPPVTNSTTRTVPITTTVTTMMTLLTTTTSTTIGTTIASVTSTTTATVSPTAAIVG